MKALTLCRRTMPRWRTDAQLSAAFEHPFGFSAVDELEFDCELLAVDNVPSKRY